MGKDAKTSPLRRSPLRFPGQSLQEEIDNLREDKIDSYLFVAVVAIMLAVYEWCNWAFHMPRQPWLVTLMAVVFTGYAVIRLVPLVRQLRQLKLGRDGERTVGQELEKLRAMGYRIYHDFIADGFNIDHIVIGPTGIFTVETKTFRKPKDPQATIGYDGHVITVPGMKLDRDPIVQARAEADHIRKWVKEYANRNAPVRPAVVFVGWYTERQPAGAEVWVLNTTGLVAFIQNERAELSQDDIVYISGVLEAHILKKQQDLYG